MEIRIKNCNIDCDDSGSLKIGGYVNVTNRESEIMFSKKRNKWFKEVMNSGVFQRAIEKASDIPLLYEHDWDKKLASTSSNTLTLKEDNVGLKFEAVINDKDVYELVKEERVNSCSFGFRSLSEEYEEINNRLEKRFVNDIELMEVSLVKNPAYVGSLAETRSYEEALEEDNKANSEVLEEDSNANNDDSKEDSTPVEEVLDKNSDNTEGASQEDTRALEESIQEPVNYSEQDLRKIVEELIAEKLNEIKAAEVEEEISNESLESSKEFHKEIEDSLEKEAAEKNYKVIKLRLDLLKLKQIKDGI